MLTSPSLAMDAGSVICRGLLAPAAPGYSRPLAYPEGSGEESVQRGYGFPLETARPSKRTFSLLFSGSHRLEE